MSRASIARKLAKEAAPHFSVLKVFLDNLRKGRAWDAAGEEAFDLARPSLMRNVRGRKAAVDDVVEAAGFDPGDLSYHGSYGLIPADDFRRTAGEMGIHVTGDPMTAIERGYAQMKGRYDLKDVVGAADDVNDMQDLLRRFYDLGESAPAGKNIAKWFKGRPRPFSHEAMSKYDFANLDDLGRWRSIDPFRLGVDYNVYPLLQKKGLKSLELPDLGRWDRPDYILRALQDIGAGRKKGSVAPGVDPNFGLDFGDTDVADAMEFYKKRMGDVDDLMALHSRGRSSEQILPWFKGLLRSEGIGAIDYPNVIEGTGELSRLILDPARNLRSPFASFKGESGWMAGLLPLISLLRGKREE